MCPCMKLLRPEAPRDSQWEAFPCVLPGLLWGLHPTLHHCYHIHHKDSKRSWGGEQLSVTFPGQGSKLHYGNGNSDLRFFLSWSWSHHSMFRKICKTWWRRGLKLPSETGHLWRCCCLTEVCIDPQDRIPAELRPEQQSYTGMGAPFWPGTGVNTNLVAVSLKLPGTMQTAWREHEHLCICSSPSLLPIQKPACPSSWQPLSSSFNHLIHAAKSLPIENILAEPLCFS